MVCPIPLSLVRGQLVAANPPIWPSSDSGKTRNVKWQPRSPGFFASPPLRWLDGKSPGDTLPFTFDISALLDSLPGDTLASFTVQILPTRTGDLVVLNQSNVGGVLTVVLSGGLPDVDYAVLFEIETTSGYSTTIPVSLRTGFNSMGLSMNFLPQGDAPLVSYQEGQLVGVTLDTTLTMTNGKLSIALASKTAPGLVTLGAGMGLDANNRLTFDLSTLPTSPVGLRPGIDAWNNGGQIQSA